MSQRENFFADGVCLHNCRCGLSPAEELFNEIPDHARVPAGAHPDGGFGRGFGQRPDRPIYG